MKFVSPAKLAVSVHVPLLANVNEQLPTAAVRDPVQLSPLEAFTVTLPVGTPSPVTLKLTVTAWPARDGPVAVEVIAVLLTALFTLIVAVMVGA